jgi:hypothetical protein
MFVSFLSKMLIRSTLVRNLRLNAMLLKKLYDVYSRMRAENACIGHWPAMYYLMV